VGGFEGKGGVSSRMSVLVGAVGKVYGDCVITLPFVKQGMDHGLDYF
jgi:hypothetical protein